MEDSRAAQRLRSLLEHRNQSEVAEAVGVRQQTISEWAAGRNKPRGQNALRVQEQFGIAVPEWYQAPLPEAQRARLTKVRPARRHATVKRTAPVVARKAAS